MSIPIRSRRSPPSRCLTPILRRACRFSTSTGHLVSNSWPMKCSIERECGAWPMNSPPPPHPPHPHPLIPIPPPVSCLHKPPQPPPTTHPPTLPPSTPPPHPPHYPPN